MGAVRVRGVRISLALLLLGGCATPEEPKRVGPLAQVTVFREPSSRDSLFPMMFAVDGRFVAQLQPEEVRSFEIEAGEHRFEYELGVYICSAQVRTDPGETYIYRLAQGCVIEPVDRLP